MSRMSYHPLSLTRFAPWTPARLRGSAVVEFLVRIDSRWRMRRGLALLSDHQLRDIGLTRAGAEPETGKPVWRA